MQVSVRPFIPVFLVVTPNTTNPMSGLGGPGGMQAGDVDKIEMGGTIAPGDVLVGQTGSEPIEGNSDPSTSAGSTNLGVIGVAKEAGVNGDIIDYWPAFPSNRFEANLISAGADLAVQTDNSVLFQTYAIAESAPDTFAVLDLSAGVNELAFARGWGRQTRGNQAGRYLSAQPDVINPRVIFSFSSSLWCLSI